MSIISNQMQAYLSAQVSDTDPGANGGAIAAQAMSLSAKNNAFPDVTLQERAEGDRKWRKIFLVNAHTELDGVSPMVVLDKPTAWGDYAWFTPGATANYESDLTGSEPMYGAALLAADAAAGDTQIFLELEDAALFPMLEAGRELLISDRSSFENATSSQSVEELRFIASASLAGALATVTLTAPLEHAFTVAAGARASTVYRPPTMRPGTANATPIWVCAVIPPGTAEYGLTDIAIGWQVESQA